MLYGIGLMLLLLSTAFLGGSALIPVGIATIGIALMVFGRRIDNGTEENTER